MCGFCLSFFRKKIYFMKTANVPLYENIAMYITFCAVCLKINYTLRCLECFRPLNLEDADKCTSTINNADYLLEFILLCRPRIARSH